MVHVVEKKKCISLQALEGKMNWENPVKTTFLLGFKVMILFTYQYGIAKVCQSILIDSSDWFIVSYNFQFAHVILPLSICPCQFANVNLPISICPCQFDQAKLTHANSTITVCPCQFALANVLK